MKHLFRAPERSPLHVVVLLLGLLIAGLSLPRLVAPDVAAGPWPGISLLTGVTLALTGTAELLPVSQTRLAGLLRITYLLCAVTQLLLLALVV